MGQSIYEAEGSNSVCDVTNLKLIFHSRDTEELKVVLQTVNDICHLRHSLRYTQLGLPVVSLSICNVRTRKGRETVCTIQVAIVVVTLHKRPTSNVAYCSSVRTFFPTTRVLRPSLAMLPHYRETERAL